ncbi:LysR family transcriptional regulator [Kitasatospora kifunensis]|uniref:DNA-binding transcriptional LysR family regulator n=1 Tax=Kitasatospora kifunensis TaxID=58351 RepID=A0A7W7QWG6_KITKI|nr:LysR family transcriptional regulator [Kitasatospora kifunensis]MBB4921066.1 DNA-binding transcriptional LysR family regulator [Kitasatospora kifunensis]
MNPHLLRTFVAVLDHRSFSTAASELGYTQSAVSQHIAALEADLGTRLIERRPVAPTAAGARLMEHAPALLLLLDAARADITRLHHANPTRLTLAHTPAALGPAVAQALAQLRTTTHPLDLEVRVLSQAAVIENVLTGSADIGLVDGAAAPSDPLPLPNLGPSTTTLAAAEQTLAVLFPLGHPLAGRASVRLTDLTQAQWIDAPDTAIPLDRLRAVCRADGFRPRIRHRGTDLHGLAALAAAGHGLAALPLPLAAALPGLAAVPVAEPRLVHRTELIHPANPTDAARQLADLVTDRQSTPGDGRR